MNLNDLVNIIPELLLYFVPGYISVRIREKYTPEKHRDDYDTTLQSIIYSFVIGIIFSVVSTIIPFAANVSETSKYLIYFIIAILIGILMVLWPNSYFSNCIAKLLNKNIDPTPNIWIKALKNENGAWATVYLENGLIYTGKLIHYTIEPEEETKQIILCGYVLYARSEGDGLNAGNFCYPIKDMSDDDSSKVLLNYDNIISIEIYPDK